MKLSIVLQIDESGTEAAAATTVVLAGCSAMFAKKNKSKKFIANRPFLFILSFEMMPLFIGKIIDPFDSILCIPRDKKQCINV